MNRLLDGKCFTDSLIDGIEGSLPFVTEVSKSVFALLSRQGWTNS